MSDFASLRLVLLGSPERSAHYRLLLAALGMPDAQVLSPDASEAANAVLLLDGGEAPASLALPGLAEPGLEHQLRPCLATLTAPEYPSLVEGLARLQAHLATARLGTVDDRDGLVAVSEKMCQLRQTIAQLAAKPVTVMINGPSGAGKELVAQAIHRLSDRADGPFVPINCGAIPRELLESELFGHERGAFTGAISSRAGRFELADGGTLFLDEIGDMPLDMQVKILRAIQERSFERVGSAQTRTADVRIVAATHRDLPALIATGAFREDLYYRLNVFPLTVPPLRERQQDIPLLIASIATRLRAEGLEPPNLTPGAVEVLKRYPWPGNVRELANLLERLAITAPSGWVGVADLPEPLRTVAPAAWGIADETVAGGDAPVLPLKEEVAALECRRINQALLASEQVVSRAAQRLGLRRTTLIEKMRRYGISAD